MGDIHANRLKQRIEAAKGGAVTVQIDDLQAVLGDRAGFEKLAMNLPPTINDDDVARLRNQIEKLQAENAEQKKMLDDQSRLFGRLAVALNYSESKFPEPSTLVAEAEIFLADVDGSAEETTDELEPVGADETDAEDAT